MTGRNRVFVLFLIQIAFIVDKNLIVCLIIKLDIRFIIQKDEITCCFDRIILNFVISRLPQKHARVWLFVINRVFGAYLLLNEEDLRVGFKELLTIKLYSLDLTINLITILYYYDCVRSYLEAELVPLISFPKHHTDIIRIIAALFDVSHECIGISRSSSRRCVYRQAEIRVIRIATLTGARRRALLIVGLVGGWGSEEIQILLLLLISS